MKEKPRYSIKAFILLVVASATIGLVIGTIILEIMGRIIGFGCQGVLVMVLFAFPTCLFSVLYGFYKSLVRHYGLQGEEKLFFGGKF